jgi:hypothetical protein
VGGSPGFQSGQVRSDFQRRGVGGVDFLHVGGTDLEVDAGLFEEVAAAGGPGGEDELEGEGIQLLND